MSFIKQSELRTASFKYFAESASSIAQAKNMGLGTIFLCHSHRDKELAEGLKNKLREQGVNLYIDWKDVAMPDEPNGETAGRIRAKIIECDILLFLATQNSLASRWCPWEIGYADGKKPLDSIVIVPTQDDQGRYYGNEYLQLYSKLDAPDWGVSYKIFAPGKGEGVLFEAFARQAKYRF